MKRHGVAVTMIAMVAAGCSLAATELKGIMRGWKADRAIAEPMAAGRTPYDEATLRRIFDGFAGDARAIEARISPTSERGKDIRSRFARFESDANAARAALGGKDRSASAIATVMNDCRACHDVYAN